MKQEKEEVKGRKYTITTIFGRAYFFVSDVDIFMTIPEENFPKHAELRGAMEAICRISSKGMKQGLLLEEVAIQMRKADMGRSLILKHMAEKIEEYVGESKI